MRKYISFLMVICLIIGVALLAGCGNSSSHSNGGEGNSTTASSPANGDWKDVKVSLEDGKYKTERYYKGVLTEECYYDAQGNPEYYVNYKYNESGQLIQVGWHGEDIATHSAGYHEYDYDENGKVVQKRILNGVKSLEMIYDYNADGSTDVTTFPRGKFPAFTNNTADNVTRIITHFDANGTKLYADGYCDQYGHLTHTEYNNDGSGTTTTYYMWDDAPEGTVSYVTTFDANEQFLQETFYHHLTGNIISITDGVFDNDGVLVGIIVHGLDVNGTYEYEMEYNINYVALWYKQYENGALLYMEENELNADGLIARINKTDSNGDLFEYITLEYYENGNVKQEMVYYGDGKLQYGHQYDEQGVATYIPPES